MLLQPKPEVAGSRRSLGVVVVNYASSTLVAELLTPLQPLHEWGVQFVVVDNFSSVQERAVIAELAAERSWHLVPATGNGGFGHGVNLGVARGRACGCDCFLLLNPDLRATCSLVETLHDAVRADPESLVVPILRATDGTVASAGSELSLQDGRVGRLGRSRPGSAVLPWVTAACLAFSDNLFSRAGGFDESYFMYWEDVDFSIRCVDLGARLVVRSDLTAVHDQGGTQGPRRGRAKSGLYYYYNIRNRMLFAVRHLDRPLVLRWFLWSPMVAWEILMRGGRRQLLHDPSLAGAAIRGWAAGSAIAVRGLIGGSVRKSLEPSAEPPEVV